MFQPAKLALEDCTVFAGLSFGADGEVDGEVCFNTSMTGYQEILTDPSYRGQIVTMTYPEIGNYGVNNEDSESARPHLAGFVVREASRPFAACRSVTRGRRGRWAVTCQEVRTGLVAGYPPALRWRCGAAGTVDEVRQLMATGYGETPGAR